MSLPAGTRLGPYEILSALGAGGMGEVYRATDTNLKRQVAIKVLPASVAGDADRLARFQREAEVLAALNHPNIAHIHGLEKSGGTIALVMELVEGPTLADRIAQGVIPLDEALPIAKQIAEALEAAHEQGIIHRDLKPANIKVRPDGTVKVLDFGLAKAMDSTGAGSTTQDPAYVSMSPTLSLHATQAGIILGTAAYMSPEQAAGKPVDKRSDVWSFGVVLWEMLTGRRLFDGETISHTLADVLRAPIDVNALPQQTPPAIRELSRRCLDRDLKTRLRDVGEARIAIERAMAQPESSAPVASTVGVRPRPAWHRALPWALACVLLVGLGAVSFIHFREALPLPPSVRFQIPPPGNSAAEMFTLSPDGRQLAFIATAGGPSQLWLRDMETLAPRALAGTDGATYPFWAPDGAYLGFFAQGKLKKIAVAGGPPQTLCDAVVTRGGTWNRDGVIVFSAGPTSPLVRVSAAGGVPAPVTTLGAGDSNAGHRFPVFLPDGIHLLYTAAGSDKRDSAGLYLGALEGGMSARLLPDVTNALYAPPNAAGGNGYLVFRREGTLMAQPFDPQALKSTGEMFPIADQVGISRNIGFGAFSVSASGALAYRTGAGLSSRALIWMDRAGKRLGTVAKSGTFADLHKISPDETTVAVAIVSGAQADIWLQDLKRDVISRFTFRPGVNRNPVWSPDGNRLVFASFQRLSTYSSEIYQKASAGNGEEALLLRAGVNAWPLDWSPDGKWILYQQTGQTTALDLWLLPLEGERKPIPYLQTPFNETNGAFSPDGRWMAYQSDESGQNQIYVQTIPASGAKYQISTAGGTQPRWRRDGKELFYVSADEKLMAVPMALGARVEPGTPQELFTVVGVVGGLSVVGGVYVGYAPSRDGQRFLVNVPAGAEGAAAPPITVVLNWQAGLKP